MPYDAISRLRKHDESEYSDKFILRRFTVCFIPNDIVCYSEKELSYFFLFFLFMKMTIMSLGDNFFRVRILSAFASVSA